MPEVTFTVPTTFPFDFNGALRYLHGSPSRIVERVTNDTYSRPLELNGTPALLSVRGPEAPGGPLRASLSGSAVGYRDLGRASALIRRVFATDVDVVQLAEHVQGDDDLGKRLAQEFHGIRPVLLPDLFETITWAVIGQQINVQFAAKCKRAFVEHFGGSFELDGETWTLFPDPERVASIPDQELLAIQFSRQKTRYVLELAREIVAGRLDLEGLLLLPAAEALERLQSLVGIGRWTAEYVLMRGIGHRDVIPAGDGGLKRIVGARLGLGRLATEDEVRAVADRWPGWRSYLAFYLWFSLQEEERARRLARQSVGRTGSRSVAGGEVVQGQPALADAAHDRLRS